jgi:superfamily II DNA or RNA helicase
MMHLRLKSDKSRPEMFPNQVGALLKADEEDNNQGYITSIMGSGKSRIIEELMIQKSCNTLIVVPTESIRDAIYEQLLEVVPKKMISTKVPKDEDFFDIKEVIKNDDNFTPERVEDKYLMDKGFKRYGGNWYKVDKAKNELSLRDKQKNKKKNKHNIVVCCYHSLREASLSFLESRELFICDEGHTARNNTIRSALLNMPNAHYKYFLSATIIRPGGALVQILQTRISY